MSKALPNENTPWVRDVATFPGGKTGTVVRVVNPRGVWVQAGDTEYFVTERSDGIWRLFAPGLELNGYPVEFAMSAPMR